MPISFIIQVFLYTDYMKIKRYTSILMIYTTLLLTAWFIPMGRDWPTFSLSTLAQFRAPYNTPEFVGMPFAFFALPHAVLPLDIGNTINLALNIIVIGLVAHRYGGKQWHFAFALAVTSPMFTSLVQSNNIDWIPLSSFLVADWLAYPLLAIKPQMLAGSALIRWKTNPQPFNLIPLIAVLILAVVLWGDWWMHLGAGLTDVAWNFAPFPYMVPLGLYILWKAWDQEDTVLGACATPFLVPYWAPYSLVGLHVLLAARYRRAAVWLWCFAWWFVFHQS